MKINDLVKAAHQNAVDHGWWEEEKTNGDLLSLIHSEISEVLEEHRNHNEPTKTYYSGKLKVTSSGSLTMTAKSDEKNAVFNTYYGEINCEKPEGIPSELADVVIRVFDMCGYYGIDLEAAIKEKMEYNVTRPYKHGGKKI